VIASEDPLDPRLSAYYEGTNSYRKCSTQTPGSVINGGLQKALGSSVDALNIADEINEIVSALFAQLLQQVITGGGGLAGVSRDSGTGKSYLQELLDNDEDKATLENLRGGSSQGITNSLVIENEFRGKKEATLLILQNTTAVIDETAACYQARIERESPTISAYERQQAEQMITLASTTKSTSITPIELGVLEDLGATEILILDLQRIQADMNSATTGIELSRASQEYQLLVSSRTLHNARDTVNAGEQRDGVATQMAPIEAKWQKNLDECVSLDTTE
jgi:hypothetical protein